MTIGTRTLATAANLTAVKYFRAADGSAVNIGNAIAPGAIGAINALVKYDSQSTDTNFDFDPNVPAQPYFNCLTNYGQLVIPSRGMLKIREGDIVAVDTATGWPILVSSAAAAGAGWTLSAING